MESPNQSSFWQFSDSLRLQTNILDNLSLNDSIWSANYAAKKPAEERRNIDFRNTGANDGSNFAASVSVDPKTELNDPGFNNDVWKASINDILSESSVNYSLFGSGLNGGWLNNDAGKVPIKDSFGRSNVNHSGFNSTVGKAPTNDSLDGSIVNYSGFGHVLNGRLNNDVWKAPINDSLSGFGPGLNGGFNKGIYPSPSLNFNSYSKGKGFTNNVAVYGKVIKGGRNEEVNGGKHGKKSKGTKEGNRESNNNGNGENKSSVDKRFKSLPPAEALPRNETVGGYIFVCNNDTMAENLKRQLFGLPPRYRDSVRSITPGLPLFLYNYSTHQLHGIFEASSFGGTNIDPSAWEDKKKPGESRFPAQVRVTTRKICEPLEEDSFRPILHHYDGPKFRLELNIPEVLSLMDIFEENIA